MPPASNPQTTLHDVTTGYPFRFEVWDNHLVLIREVGGQADLAELLEIKPGAGRIHLQTYVDQTLGRILVVDDAGHQLADLKVTDKNQGNPAGGIQLINHQGDVRLEHLRISRWSGEVPADQPKDKTRVQQTDGAIVYGQIDQFDPLKKQFVVKNGEKSSRIDADKIASLVLNAAADDSPLCSIRAVTQDGIRVSGALNQVKNGQLKLNSPNISEPITLPVDHLKSLTFLQPGQLKWPTDALTGRLELPEVRLFGWLENGEQNANGPADSTCLNWHPRRQPEQCSAAQRSGRPNHLSRPAAAKNCPAIASKSDAESSSSHLAGPPVGGGVAAAVVQGITSGAISVASKSKNTMLYLRTGDTVPCTVKSIDENGVTVQTALSDATFIPHQKIKALVMAPFTRPGGLDKDLRSRLLTLPRMQKTIHPHNSSSRRMVIISAAA